MGEVPRVGISSVEGYQRYTPIWPIGNADRGLRRLFDSLAYVRDIDHTGAGVLTDMAEQKGRTSFEIGKHEECRVTRTLSGQTCGQSIGEVMAVMAEIIYLSRN
jgi:hypothetical protein